MKLFICLICFPILAAAQGPIIIDSSRGPITIDSAASPIIIRTTTPPVDTIPPSIPQDVAASGVTTTGFTVSWSASTDPEGHYVNYIVHINGIQSSLISTTSYAFSAGSPNTAYSVYVTAIDEFANESGPSDTITVNTLPSPGNQLGTPVFRSENILSYSYYMSWDTVTGAEFYIAHRATDALFTNPVQVHKGGGPDFLDVLEAGRTYYYRVKAFNQVDSAYTDSDWLTRTVTTTSETTYTGTIVSDKVRDVFTIHPNYRVTRDGGTFSAGDIGKIISIQNAAIQPWYSEDSLWLNSFIVGVSGDSAILGQYNTTYERPMGDSLIYALQVTDHAGFYGTNAYDALMTDMVAAQSVSGRTLRYSYSDTALADPFRSRLWWDRTYFNTGAPSAATDSAGIYAKTDVCVKGLKLLIATQDFVGKPTGISPRYRWVNYMFVGSGGTFRIDSSIFSVQSDRQVYSLRYSYFFLTVSNTNVKRVMMTNSNLTVTSGVYYHGFTSGFLFNTQNSGQKQFTYLNNCTVESSEPFGAQNHSANNTYYSGLRVTTINSNIIGSARSEFTYSGNISFSGSTLIVDSTATPEFTFRFTAAPHREYIGQNTAFWTENSSTVYYGTIISNYRLALTTSPGVFTKIAAATLYNGNGAIQSGDGHMMYPSPNVEMYFDTVNMTQQYKLIWRYNDDEVWGTYRGGAQRYMGNSYIEVMDTASFLFPDWLQMNISANVGTPANNRPSFNYPKGIDSTKYGYWENNTGCELRLNGDYCANFYAENIEHSNLPPMFTVNKSNKYVNTGGAYLSSTTGAITPQKGNTYMIVKQDSTDRNVMINVPNLKSGGTISVYGGGAGFSFKAISTDPAVEAQRDTVTMNFTDCVYGTGSFSFSDDTNVGYPLFVEGAKYRINTTGQTYDTGRIFRAFSGQSGYKFFWPNPAFWSTNSRCATFTAQTSGWGVFDWCIDD